MTIEEAKTLLQGYRPNGADAGDPAFAEALELVRMHPALGEWFARQQDFDLALSAEHEQVPVPRELRDRILASVTARKADPKTKRRAWWRGAVPLAFAGAAAVAVLVGVTFVLWPKPKLPAADSALAAVAIDDAQRPKTHGGGHGEETATLKGLLNKPTTQLSDPLPTNYTALRDAGCRKITVEGRDVLEVCFKRNGVGLHCYIARREDFPTLTAPSKPTVTDKSNASVATWADSANLYIVVTKPDRAALEKLL